MDLRQHVPSYVSAFFIQETVCALGKQSRNEATGSGEYVGQGLRGEKGAN